MCKFGTYNVFDLSDDEFNMFLNFRNNSYFRFSFHSPAAHFLAYPK